MDAVAILIGNHVDATCLLATVILMMAGATKADGMAQIIYVSPPERNIVQTEDEGKDLRGKPSLKPTVDFTAI